MTPDASRYPHRQPHSNVGRPTSHFGASRHANPPRFRDLPLQDAVVAHRPAINAAPVTAVYHTFPPATTSAILCDDTNNINPFHYDNTEVDMPPPAYTPRASIPCGTTRNLPAATALFPNANPTQDEEDGLYDDSASDTSNLDADDEAEDADDEAEPTINVTVNASTTVHGHQNTITAPRFDESRSAILVAQLIQAHTRNLSPSSTQYQPTYTCNGQVPKPNQQFPHLPHLQPHPEPHSRSSTATPPPAAAAGAATAAAQSKPWMPKTINITIQAGVHIVGNGNTMLSPLQYTALAAVKARLASIAAQAQATATTNAHANTHCTAAPPVHANPAVGNARQTAAAGLVALHGTARLPFGATPIPSPPVSPTLAGVKRRRSDAESVAAAGAPLTKVVRRDSGLERIGDDAVVIKME